MILNDLHPYLIALLRGVQNGHALPDHVSEDENGMKYVGSWKSGKREGQGTLYDHTGAVRYEGAWRNDSYHGQGTYNGEEGDTYTGNWKNGKRHGQGTYTGIDGVTYEGAWANDKRHGLGVEKNAAGEVISEGEWKNNELRN